ncbi:MAG TPA: alkaline phosphatase D family protein, partial [Acidobacteriota bacterium]|nr:alkaline phosphatase D family protein [Acidobacteriota bacterium]
MATLTRRDFIQLAGILGASLAWGSAYPFDSTSSWTERREIYPQGVASGDPYSDSILLWTRRPPSGDSQVTKLMVEIADNPAFKKIIAKADASISAETDWTCRILVAGLKPRTIYWYRFTDEHGFGSRVGRTVTAPSDKDPHPVRFSFVSCQNVQMGPSLAYRRMIWEDEQRPPEDQLGFVLHLGDFVYEIMWYPEDRPQGYYDRHLRDIVRYANGDKYRDFHFPTTVDDYRALYRAYLTDPDLQDARARWPFICMWDNHEFSWKGWQSQQNFGGVRPAQKIKVAANQAWFEYQPARVVMPNKTHPDRFEAPDVANAPLDKFDDNGLGLEPGNIAAINSLKVFRTLNYGRNVQLILTDNRSFASQPVTDLPEVDQFEIKDVPYFFPLEIIEILDAGRAYNGGKPPDTIQFYDKEIPNPRKNSPPQSVL